MSGKFKASAFLVSAALLFLPLQSARAQEVNLSGTVQNQSGDPISDAQVTLKSNTSISTTTGSDGKFVLSGHTNPIIWQKSSWKSSSASLSGSHIVVNLSESSPVDITIHSMAGKKITGFSTRKLDAGMNTIALPLNTLGAGAYMIAVDHEETRSLLRYISSSPSTSGSFKAAKNMKKAVNKVAAAKEAIDTIEVTASDYLPANHPMNTHDQSGIEITLESSGSGSRLDNIDKPCGGDLMPDPISGGQSGWGSRYWDCCKPHCSWPDNTSNLAANCDMNDEEMPCYEDKGDWLQGTDNGCQGGPAFTCYSHVPFAVCENLAYAFAAVPGGDDDCGKCFQLDFDGGFEHGDPKEAHQLMAGKSMIVIASNIGHDVAGGQFDIMIPGGGLGAFEDGCARQWGVDKDDESLVGATYGGFTTTCEQQLGFDASAEDMKGCVRSMCDNLFGDDPEMKDLHEGCIWYVEWMHAVNNPTFKYKEVPCPQELMDLYYTTEH
ncbi:MAG: carboxypeptidase regulatory-like domain-containing protein [Chitinispirillaceae bacterium]